MSSSVETSPDIALKYPIGRFRRPAEVSEADLKGWITDIEELPAQLALALAGLDEQKLDTRYRPDGWTVRQVVHHLADSHMNSVLRYRFALTEANPTIADYKEAVWAELPDAKTGPVDLSVSLLTGIHQRWVLLLRSMDAAQFARTFVHPERGEMRLDWSTGLYAWHGRHHVAQITSLRRRENWDS